MATKKKPTPKPTSKRSPAALKEYKAKRDFAVTPEPAPGPVKKGAGPPTFMVHKHDATRLHYDLRLEMDGALASWAIPKGPIYDPDVKRLAVQTEDHPLEYGSFEGRIPDFEYGGGDSLIWDRGTYDTFPPGQASAMRQKGHLDLEMKGEKLKGRWHLVRTRGQEGKPQWLFFKAKDGLETKKGDIVVDRPESVVSGRRITRGPERVGELRKARQPPDKILGAYLPPMLATLAEVPPEGPWLYELKYDGFRAIAGLSAGKVALLSRNGLDLATRFPDVARALTKVVVGDAVIDGEVVAPDAEGVPRFERLQQGQATRYMAFDLLRLDGEDLRARPLEERRELLVSLLSNMPVVLSVAERLTGTGAQALTRAAGLGHEGIVAKLLGSRWENVRSRSWIKVKAQKGQELAILGFTPIKDGGKAIGALLLGVADGDGYRFAGKVGTGFSDKLRGELYRTLSKDRVEKSAAAEAPKMRDATWVKPRHVAQVSFTEWTHDGKLRHPSFLGLRTDKSPSEAVREVAQPQAKTPSPRVTVALTHPERILWPKDHLKKSDLAAYYEAVSGPLLAALEGRPLSLEHWNDGVHKASWYQQDLGKDVEPWMHVVDTPATTSRSGSSVRHLVADSPDALRWLAQRSVLTLHTWLSREGSLRTPDFMVFDLDPADGKGIAQTLEPALALKALLDELSIPSFPKTSGKRGLHVLVPLLPGHTFDDAVEFGLKIGGALAQVLPGSTLERTKSKRKGRLYIDVLQNAYAKTIVAPYSPRGIDGAPVSAPLTWDEVNEDLDPFAFNLRTMPARLKKVGDLFAPLARSGVRLPRLRG